MCSWLTSRGFDVSQLIPLTPKNTIDLDFWTFNFFQVGAMFLTRQSKHQPEWKKNWNLKNQDPWCFWGECNYYTSSETPNPWGVSHEHIFADKLAEFEKNSWFRFPTLFFTKNEEVVVGCLTGWNKKCGRSGDHALFLFNANSCFLLTVHTFGGLCFPFRSFKAVVSKLWCFKL